MAQRRSFSRFLAWFAIAYGVIAITVPAWWSMLSSQPLPVATLAVYVLLGLASLVAGIFGLRGNRWAFILLFVTFLVQGAEYVSQTFAISLIGPLSLKLGLILKSPPGWFNVNVLAIVVCVLALRSAKHMSERSDA